MFDIIIVGAGAAGLTAARKLLHAGKSICVLEARDRVGGRIMTIRDNGFSSPVEGGAEFIHGEFPHTMALMKEAEVSYQAGAGKSWNVVNGEVKEGDLFDESWEAVIQKLQSLERDMTMYDFLQTYFKDDKHKDVRERITAFVEGYDAADLEKVSAFALREEWSSEDIKGYHPVGGYGQLMDFLHHEIVHAGVDVQLNAVVKSVKWRADEVHVITTDDRHFKASKILLTLPVSLLKQRSIHFEPPLLEHDKSFQALEMGGVIKFLVEFKDPVWERKGSAFRYMPQMHFLFSDAFIPTWWTQRPSAMPLLTGWLAGPGIHLLHQDTDVLLEEAYKSLGYLLDVNMDLLKSSIRSSVVVNWSSDPFSSGAYAYKTLKTSQALKQIMTPVHETIYFAGEGIYDGPEMGTVEAAIASGLKTAENML